MLAVHTSPLAQPGTGDAGGMNVYVLQSALHLARRGIEVEIFTRATASADPPVVRVAPGVLVRNVVAGPFEGLDKYDLPTQLCAFAAGVLRAEAAHEPGYYDIVHSHYWLSGQVGWLARDRWAVPLVHTAHTLAAVKNAALADGDTPEPPLRTVGEQQVVDEADRLIVNTEDEAQTIGFAAPCRSGRESTWSIPVSTWTCSVRATAAPPGPRWAPARRGRGGVRRTNPAAEGARRRAARRRETAGGARRGGRRAVGQRSGRRRTDWFGSPTNWASRPRVTFLPPQSRARSGHLVPGRRSGCGAELFGVVRSGRHRGAGLRDAGGGGRGRRVAGGGARRGHRHPGGRSRRRSVGGGHRRAAAARRRAAGMGDEPLRRPARGDVLLGEHHRRAAGQLPARDRRLHRRAPAPGARRVAGASPAADVAPRGGA